MTWIRRSGRSAPPGRWSRTQRWAPASSGPWPAQARVSPARPFDDDRVPRRRTPRRVGDLLPEAARALGLEEQLRWARATAAWDRLVEARVPTAAGGSRPTRLERDGTLIVEASAPIVGQELLMRADELLAAHGRSPMGSGPGRCGWWWAGVSSGDPGGRPSWAARSPATGVTPARLRAPGPPIGMAVRLQMKLGLVAEPERLEDSPDTIAIVEPTIGATVRSKGSLYVVVTGVGRGRRLREATHLVADTIQGEYYYDESAGLVVCLEKAIRAANRRLLAQRERLALGAGPAGPSASAWRSSGATSSTWSRSGLPRRTWSARRTC